MMFNHHFDSFVSRLMSSSQASAGPLNKKFENFHFKILHIKMTSIHRDACSWKTLFEKKRSWKEWCLKVWAQVGKYNWSWNVSIERSVLFYFARFSSYSWARSNLNRNSSDFPTCRFFPIAFSSYKYSHSKLDFKNRE